MLGPDQIRTHYDALGADQDRELRYAGPVFDWIVNWITTERGVIELGCGTGTLAERLLRAHPEMTYIGLDISAGMARLTESRVKDWVGRVAIGEADVTEGLDVAGGVSDLVIAAYLFDLLDHQAMQRVLQHVRAALAPDGKLILVTMVPGGSPLQRLRSLGWTALHKVAPGRVGGCRPVRLSGRLQADGWHIIQRQTFQNAGVRSELLIVRPRH